MNEGTPPSATTRVTILFVLAALSGSCGLAYEILYVRALSTLLGDMLYVHAALLSTFLVGIGIGAKLAHRFLRWLAALEILTGLYALALPPLAKWLSLQPVMIPISASANLTIAATIALVAIPSLLVGFSIPLFSAYIKAAQADRLAFQGVYKLYNLGALLSILAVELILIRKFGVRISLAIIGSINLLNGVILIILRNAPRREAAPVRMEFSRKIIAALALASLASAVFQMFFLKLTYLVFGPHRENFAIGLSVTMLGIFAGAWLASRTRIRFVTILVLIPVVLGAIYFMYAPIVLLYKTTFPMVRSSEIAIIAHKFLISCIFALGPMILFGATIPALMYSEKQVADESGRLLFVSSLANAIGYLAYVTVGHPLLTSNILLVILAALCLLASLLVVDFRWGPGEKRLVALGVLAIAIMAFRWSDRDLYLARWVGSLPPSADVTTFKSGAENATLVRQEHETWVTYNGFPSINVYRDGVINHAEIICGILPALSAPRIERVMIIGCGTGITSGTAAQIFPSVDVADINNAFYKMLPLLDAPNMDLDGNPAATLHLCDGRTFLIGKTNEYDAIVNSLPAPTYFSAGKLYTLEFYERVRQALKPDGVFCTWIAASDMSTPGIGVYLSALHHSFEYCDLTLLRSGYYMATCSNAPIHRRQFSELSPGPKLIPLLEQALHGFDLDEYFDDMHVSQNIFAHYIPNVPEENTDDHPVLEFLSVRNTQMQTVVTDPFSDNAAMFDIDVTGRPETMTPQRFARRAGAFWKFSPHQFERCFPPIFDKHHDLRAAFWEWKAAYERG